MNKKFFRSFVAVVLAVIMLISLFSFVFTLSANADEPDQPDVSDMTSEELEAELERLNNEKSKARENVSNAQNKVEQLKAEQSLVIEAKIALEERNEAAQKEIEIIEQQVSVINEDIRQYDIKIQVKEQEVVEAKEKEDLQLEKYRSRIRAMEESGGFNLLSFIIGAKSLSELLSAIDDYGDIMDSDVLLYDQLQEARKNHELVKQDYEDLKKEAEKVKAGYEEDIEDLETEKEKLEEQIAESEAEIEEYTEEIKKAEEEQKRMEAIEAAAAAAASSFLTDYYARKAALQNPTVTTDPSTSTDPAATIDPSTGTVTEPAQQPGAGTVYEDGNGTGSFCWPFPGHTNITSYFGYRSSTSSYHTGVDIDGYQSMGSPIVAADSGVVIKAEYSGGYGNCIIIDHGNGMSTLYAHLSSMAVGAGSSVSKGQTIGGVGNTGTCYGIDGVHLHFEVLINGQQVDPMGYI